MDVKSTCSMTDSTLVTKDNDNLQLSHEGIIRLVGLKVNSKKPHCCQYMETIMMEGYTRTATYR